MHATATDYGHLDNAAKAIGFAVLFDGLDGRIARMTGTTSDFGKELDSLADAITFGVAPALLAWTWGFHLMPVVLLTEWHIKLTQLGGIASFLFLIAGMPSDPMADTAWILLLQRIYADPNRQRW